MSIPPPSAVRRMAPVATSPLPRQRQRLGWPALLFSIALHGGAVLAAAYFTFGGVGAGGDIGIEAEDEPMTMTLPLPFKTKQVVEQTAPPKPTNAFMPSTMRRLMVESPTALALPKWDMPQPQVIEGSPPVEQPKPPTKAAKPESSPPARKAPGKGKAGSAGNAMIAMRAPQIIRSSAPPYPLSAKRAKIEGTATVRVAVSDSGQVVSCEIYRSTGNEDLDEAALRSVKGWRFSPGMKATQAVAADVLVRVVFRLT